MVPLTEGFFIVGIVLGQVIYFLLLFSRSTTELIHKRPFRKIVIFLLLQLLGIFFILVGGYLEKEERLYTRIRKPLDEYRHSSPESPTLGGDPGLVEWAESQEVVLPRPNVDALEEFRLWQTSLRERLRTVFDLSELGVLAEFERHQISSTTIVHDITRIFLTFESFDGTSIPAYLFIPPGEGTKPAVLVLSGHVGRYEEGISQTAGLVDSYQHGAALGLAKAGFVTLTIEFRGFGYLGPQKNTEHKLVAYNALLGGSFYKAIVSKDIKYAVDLLQSFSEVDPLRIGVTGVSYGGEMAVTYAALDERIAAVVSQGYGESIGMKQGVYGKETEQPHYCHIIPGQNTFLLQEDLFLLITPRPLLGVNGSHDSLVQMDSQMYRIVSEAYELFDVSSRFQFETWPGGHEYFVQPAVQFFKQYL